MRILIFLLALTSAFFVNAATTDPIGSIYDLDDLRPPLSKPKYYFECDGGNYEKLEVSSDSNDIEICQSYWQTFIQNTIDIHLASGFYASAGSIIWTSSNTYTYEYTRCRYGDCDTFGTEELESSSGQSTGRFLRTEWQHSCPHPSYPEHQHPIMKNPQPTDPAAAPMDCAKLLDGEPEPDPDLDDDNCPPTNSNGPDSFTGGLGQQTTICYNNSNGTQCRIETDENGGYYHPSYYGSQEPSACLDPDPTDPDPTDPDPTDPDPTDPNPTPDPDERPDPEDTDDTDKTEVLDAVNQVNDNLDAINNNMLDGIESHEERLDRMAEEVQTSNELLAAISDGQAEGNGLLSDIGDGQAIGNDLLEEIAENTKKEDFSISSRRKAEEGLNAIFSDEDLQQVKDEIDTKKEELDTLIETIQNEARSLIDIPASPSSGYEERIVNIKGADVDLGLGRISDFFKLIGPAVLLCATLTALYILLGSKE
ncbi:hypothetical protein [Pseudoalteromonas gelatinilytica]